jgi:hypothetical protein
MGTFDFGAEAELFSNPARASRRQPIGYRRFARAADAIRYAIEELAPASLAGAYLEVGEERFDSRDMRRLYESPSYPHPRREHEASAPASPAAVPRTTRDSPPLPGPPGKKGVHSAVSPHVAPRFSTGAKKTRS